MLSSQIDHRCVIRIWYNLMHENFRSKSNYIPDLISTYSTLYSGSIYWNAILQGDVWYDSLNWNIAQFLRRLFRTYRGKMIWFYQERLREKNPQFITYQKLCNNFLRIVLTGDIYYFEFGRNKIKTRLPRDDFSLNHLILDWLHIMFGSNIIYCYQKTL